MFFGIDTASEQDTQFVCKRWTLAHIRSELVLGDLGSFEAPPEATAGY